KLAAILGVALCLATGACDRRVTAAPAASPSPSAPTAPSTPTPAPTTSRTPDTAPGYEPTGAARDVAFPGGLRAPAGTRRLGPAFTGPDGKPGTGRTWTEQVLLVTGDPYAVLRDLHTQLDRGGYFISGPSGCEIGPLTVTNRAIATFRGYLTC